MQVSWEILKQVTTERALSIQWVDLTDSYQLMIIDGLFILECNLSKSDLERTQDFEVNYKAAGNKKLNTGMPPFAAKILADGKKLYLRMHGISSVVTAGVQNIDFSVPYVSCKITGLGVIGGALGDTINLKILDTPTGTITGVPNYVLNQFGFNVNVVPAVYHHSSEYDADLIQNLKVRIEYTTAETVARTIYVNLVLHEVKP